MKYLFYRNWDLTHYITKYDTRWSASLWVGILTTLIFTFVSYNWEWGLTNWEGFIFVQSAIFLIALGVSYRYAYNQERINEYLHRSVSERRSHKFFGRLITLFLWISVILTIFHV